MKLFEIHEAIQRLSIALDGYADEHEGLISPELEEELDKLELAREEKLKNLYYVIKEKQFLLQSIKSEQDRIAKLKDRTEKQVQWLKNYVAFALEGEALDFGTGGFSFRSSQAVELDVIPSALPEAYTYRHVEIKADKTLLKEDLRNGVKIEGARLVNRKNLQVK